MPSKEVIQRSIHSHVLTIMLKHGVKECIIVFPIIERGQAEIFCSQMKEPGTKGLPQMEAVKAYCDQMLTAMQTPKE